MRSIFFLLGYTPFQKGQGLHMSPLKVYPFLLTFTTLWANSADDTLMIFSQKTGFDISVSLHEMSILFPGKDKKNILKCHLLKILPRMLSIESCEPCQAKNRTRS